MNKLFFSFIIFLSLVACNSKNNQQESPYTKKAIIEGKIENRNVYPNLSELKLIVYDFGKNEQIYISPISESGTFRFEFIPEATREVFLSPSDDIIVIKPGDSLFIEKNFRNITKSKFSGIGADINNEIKAFTYRYLGKYSIDSEHWKNYETYKAACDNEKEKNLKLLASYRKKATQTSDEFHNWALKKIELDYAKTMLPYSEKYLYHGVKKNKEEYYAYLKNLEKIFDNSIIMADYFQVAENFLHYKSVLWGNKLDITELETIEDIDKLFQQFINYTSLSTQNKYLAEFSLYNYLQLLRNTDMEINYHEFIRDVFKDPYINYLIQNKR